MLKSSNFNSIIDESASRKSLNNDDTAYSLQVVKSETYESQNEPSKNINYNNNYENNSCQTPSPAPLQASIRTTEAPAPQASISRPSLAALQLSVGLLQIYEPPLLKARVQLKELIAKQNIIYIDLSGEKFKLENAEIAKLQSMMDNVRIYKEKLVKIKKQMQHIYQRTISIEKRAVRVFACSQKELERKLQKQQQEEALIGSQETITAKSIVSPAPTLTPTTTASLINRK